MDNHLIHATCVAINHKAVLITGASGSGKSDLALRLIKDAGATLISDDQTSLHLINGHVLASPPDTIQGLLEVRVVGIVPLPFMNDIAVALQIEL